MHTKNLTKTPNTKETYERIRRTLLGHATLMKDRGELGDVTDHNVLLALACHELEPHVQPATARIYRAAAIHGIQSAPTEFSDQAMEILVPELSEIQTERLHWLDHQRAKNLTELRGSQQRDEHPKQEDWTKLINGLRDCASGWRWIAAMWLLCTMETGLRPHEWQDAILEGHALVVKNAKNTNGRAHGASRTIDLYRANKATKDLIEGFLVAIRPYKNSDFHSMYNCVRNLIGVVGRRVLSTREKYPTIYSARHGFASRAKMQFPKDVVAALMGHASIDTASRHYAAARYARGGMPLEIEPAPSDVEAVRRIQAAKQAKAAIPLSEEMR